MHPFRNPSHARKLSLLLLCLPLYGYVLVLTASAQGNDYEQVLGGSFVETTHFYRRCLPHEGEIIIESNAVAWRGERINKAIILWNNKAGEQKVTPRISDFRSSGDTIPSEVAFLRSLGYVRADAISKPCGGYSDRDPEEYLELGDILYTELDSAIRHNCPSVYWLTLDIPSPASPGQYSGTVSFTADRGNEVVLHLIIEVVDHHLPPVDQWSFHLDLWQYPSKVLDRYNEQHPDHPLTCWSDEHFSLIRKQYELLGEMGQKVVTAHIKEGALGSPSMIRWIMHPDSSWSYEFTVFDRYVDSLMSWGIYKQINCQSPAGWNSDVIPYWCGSEGEMKELPAPFGSETCASRWSHFLDHFRIHLMEKGWFDRAVLFLDEVEPEKLNWIVELVKMNHPDWKIGLAGFHTPTDFIASRVYDLSLMVGISGNPEHSKHDGIATFYTSCNPVRPNNFIAGDAAPTENIWIGWYARCKGYDGFLRWAYDNWTTRDPREQRVGAYSSGDFSFAYRSSNELDMEIWSSVRLELIREGIEDFEKIGDLNRVLKQSGSPDDLYQYARLQAKLNEFAIIPGTQLEMDHLVGSAQQLLDEIVTFSK